MSLKEWIEQHLVVSWHLLVTGVKHSDIAPNSNCDGEIWLALLVTKTEEKEMKEKWDTKASLIQERTYAAICSKCKRRLTVKGAPPDLAKQGHEFLQRKLKEAEK